MVHLSSLQNSSNSEIRFTIMQELSPAKSHCLSTLLWYLSVPGRAPGVFTTDIPFPKKLKDSSLTLALSLRVYASLITCLDELNIFQNVSCTAYAGICTNADYNQ